MLILNCFNMETFNVYLLLVVIAILGKSGENVAIGKSTKQSSTAFDGVSSRAVDGNTINKYFEGNSCTHTNSSQTEWWCVDLQAVYNNISYILLYNRAINKERLQGFTLKTSINGECNEEGFTSATTCYINTSSSEEDIYTVDTCNQPQSSLSDTRLIFISVKNNYLTLCEVQVIVCPTNCKDRKCNNTEECTDGCKSGYFGNKCNVSCNNCNNGCNQLNGKCIGGCKGKFYGDKCEMACTTCQTSCQQSDGFCNNGGCVDGYWGAKCLKSCSSNCVRRQCGQVDGRCTSCPDGKYGFYCEQTCNNGCIEKDCDRDGGRCSKGCIRGKYSDHCNKDCTVTNCVGNCDRTSGHCNNCTTGWYGNNCESKCSSKCSSACDQSTGRCDDCIGGRFGDGCEKVCPPNCVGGCNRFDGKCKSCKPDTVGDYCEPVSDKPTPNINCRFTECIDGEYSDKCEKNCSESCKYVCQRNDGTCTVAGINKKMTEDSSISPVTTGIIGFIVGVAVTVIVGVLIYIFYIKRRMIKKPSTGTEGVIYNNRSDTDGNINTTYDTLDQVSHDNRDKTYTSLDNRESQHEYYNQESRGDNPLENKDNQYYNITKQ